MTHHVFKITVTHHRPWVMGCSLKLSLITSIIHTMNIRFWFIVMNHTNEIKMQVIDDLFKIDYFWILDRLHNIQSWNRTHGFLHNSSKRSLNPEIQNFDREWTGNHIYLITRVVWFWSAAWVWFNPNWSCSRTAITTFPFSDSISF